MTHAPASGPFMLVTTPPRSELPMAISAAGRCWALTSAKAPARHDTTAITATFECLLILVFICSVLPCKRLAGFREKHVRPRCRDGRLNFAASIGAFICVPNRRATGTDLE